MANVWVQAWDGRIIRESQVQMMAPGTQKRNDWWVVAVLGRKEQISLAKIGRGARSQAIAIRLASEWPQAVAAAKPGDSIRCVDGQWSTIAAAHAAKTGEFDRPA
jgi:hypothetical protein